MSIIKINEQVTVGGQPSEEQLEQFGKQGFKSIVNFRQEAEEPGQLPPHEEEEMVTSQGMQYLHIPVSMQSMAADQVDRFRQQFPKLPKPVFAHCKSGKRAGAMVMMHLAVEQGMSGDQTLANAKEMGFECDKPELQHFVREYIDSHRRDS